MQSQGIKAGTFVDLAYRPPSYDIPSIRSEERLCAHVVACACLKILGICGEFLTLEVIGDLDFTWVGRVENHSKFFAADMLNLKIFFDLSEQDRDQNTRQSVDALEQIYGYMTFNHGRYGALVGPFPFNRAFLQPGAYVSFKLRKLHFGSGALLVLATGNRFGWLKKGSASFQIVSVNPQSFGPPERHFSDTKTGDPMYERNAGKFTFEFKAKVVDITGPDFIRDVLTEEVAVYAALNRLQGSVIPRVYGYFELWGMLALKDVSEAVGDMYPKGTTIPPNVKACMIAALKQIYSPDFLHDDIAHFCVKNEVVYILDLEDAVRSDVLSKHMADHQALDAL
ncbi:hypothetical protein PILCRDRAFT_6462 [Piloderma croceum F 1598]|uniref:Uncharacterized protein n=1 Tax=Piloderma croceum (strain F 1598) TaxID=765440 RepID=A0A0C3FIJ1_PILCF|nr:hypothetical protein PILCRDRAFT_6462 [Piloderma croceum F 1598]